MTDIVERLRGPAQWLMPGYETLDMRDAFKEAADEIKRLRTALYRLAVAGVLALAMLASANPKVSGLTDLGLRIVDSFSQIVPVSPACPACDEQ